MTSAFLEMTDMTMYLTHGIFLSQLGHLVLGLTPCRSTTSINQSLVSEL